MTPTNDDRERGSGSLSHVVELLDMYRTGELDASRRADVEAHLEVCESCRAELGALGSWAATIERGYAAIRSGARDLEPDWGAQRAAVVERTSGRRSTANEGWSFRRWAPQFALVAVAALIVGVVWRERARAPGGESETAMTRSTDDAPEEQVAIPDRGPDQDASAFRGTEAQTAENARAPAAEMARERAGAPPAADEEALEDEADALGKAEAVEAEEERAVRQEARADRAAEPSLAAPIGEIDRFEREARAALGARDTAAARRALALWSDTLAAAGIDGERAALADSLARFLEAAE